VYGKGIEPAVTVGKLVATVRGTEWTVGTVGLGSPLSGDEDEEGPWTFSVDDLTRDTLAGIEDEVLRELAAWRGRIPEWPWAGPLPEEETLSMLTNLVDLARQAKAAERHLYCWCSL
jgi:hypothetical protein